MLFNKQIFKIGTLNIFGWMLAVSGLMSQSTISSLNDDLKSIVESNGSLVALGIDNNLYTSDDDGASFSESLPDSTAGGDIYYQLGAVGSTVIGVGVDGLILRSADSGATWADVSVESFFGSLFAVAGRTDGSNDNVWVAVGDDGFTDSVVYTSSDDGITWSESAIIANSSLSDILWTGSAWVAVGRDDFDAGVVYRSTDDGDTWTASTLTGDGIAPLKALAINGDGDILAVGELGTIIRSTDDGVNFSLIAAGLASQDLLAVAATSGGEFYIGGADKIILEVNGVTGSTVIPPANGGAQIEEIIVINGEPFVVGEFSSEPAESFDLTITATSATTFDLDLSDSSSGKTYFLQSNTDLTEEWTTLNDSGLSGTGSALSWSVSIAGDKRFWRVQEF